mmetsp:Transcript_57715/g.141579  ORF Transcript_57715/g.141579 Transcript_57715/m.141579 type:complete len:218 (-) Transcript_57715:239-892(-)
MPVGASEAHSDTPAQGALLLFVLDQHAHHREVVGGHNVVFLEQRDMAFVVLGLGDLVAPDHVLQPDPVRLDSKHRLHLQQVVTWGVEQHPHRRKVHTLSNLYHLSINRVHRHHEHRQPLHAARALERIEDLREVVGAIVHIRSNGKGALRCLDPLGAQQRPVLIPLVHQRLHEAPLQRTHPITPHNLHTVSLAEAPSPISRELDLVALEHLGQHLDL